MLERASSCLRFGGRNTFRGSRKKLRSRRMLHSSFWHHGAGDLDLPPWWATILQPTTAATDSTTDHQTSSGAASSLDLQISGNSGLFLDFLYPAKTLALIQTISSYRWEPWERRRVRHSTTAPLRQYSSTPGTTQVEQPETLVDTSSLNDQKAVGSGVQDYSDTPANSRVSQAQEELRNLLQTKSEKEEDFDRAWQLWLDIKEYSPDWQLAADLVDYISLSRGPETPTRVLELFTRLPSEQRRASSYRAVVATYVQLSGTAGAINPSGELQDWALEHVRKAVAVWEEASSRRIQGDIGVGLLFARCIGIKNWDLASRIYHNHLRRSQGQEFQETTPDIWQLVPRLPDLIDAISSLVTLGAETSSGRMGYGSEASEALLKAFRRRYGAILYGLMSRAYDQIPSADPDKVVKLFRQLRSFGLSKGIFYERSILQLLHSTDTSRYGNHTKTTMRLYALYISERSPRLEKDGLKPSEKILFFVLKRLCDADVTSGPVTVKSVTADWRNLHGQLSQSAMILLMNYYAERGDVLQVQGLFKGLESTVDGLVQNVAWLRPLLYVRARRAEVPEAIREFERISRDFHLEPDNHCWNILLYTHARADDLDGALRHFRDMMDRGFGIDMYSFGPVLQLCAERGDVDSVEELLDLAEAQKVTISAAMTGSLVLAHIRNEDLRAAERAAFDAAKAKRTDDLTGELTRVWNTLLTAYALRRNVASVQRLYKRMHQFKIPVDVFTYSAIMHVLTLRRRTQDASMVLTHIMPAHHVTPTALHYAILMAGFANEGALEKAFQVEEHMQGRGINHNISTRIALLKARSLLLRESTASGIHRPIEAAKLEDESDLLLESVLGMDSTSTLGSKSPQLGLGATPFKQAAELTLDFLLPFYDKERAHTVVQRFLEKAMAGRTRANIAPSMRLLSTLMTIRYHDGNHAEVERYWQLAVFEAARYARPVASGSIPSKQPPPSVSSGFVSSPMYELDDTFEPEPASSAAPGDPENSNLNSEVPGNSSPRIAPGRRGILSRPLSMYLRSLIAQAKYPTMISTMKSLSASGYTFDSKTWSLYIRALARASQRVPPTSTTSSHGTILAESDYDDTYPPQPASSPSSNPDQPTTETSSTFLIKNPDYLDEAFRACETHLMPSFPGWDWIHVNSLFRRPSQRPRAPRGYEGMRLRKADVHPGVVRPQYGTLAVLGEVVRWLREGTEGLGWEVRKRRQGPEVWRRLEGKSEAVRKARLLGALRRIARRTVGAVEVMPRLWDMRAPVRGAPRSSLRKVDKEEDKGGA